MYVSLYYVLCPSPFNYVPLYSGAVLLLGKLFNYLILTWFPSLPPSGTPTLPELLSFSDRKVNIAEQIGVKYLNFGLFLLEDCNGAIVTALENEHQKNAERINFAIFQKWLEGKGVKPVTWSTLVTVLQNINM